MPLTVTRRELAPILELCKVRQQCGEATRVENSVEDSFHGFPVHYLDVGNENKQDLRVHGGDGLLQMLDCINGVLGALGHEIRRQI